MPSLPRNLLKAALCFGSILPVLHATPIDQRDRISAADTITVDVCIVGGGSTGTYSAVRLSQDLGKTVVVVEKTDRLGGHTETYIDPITGFPVDYGVQAFHNLSVVTNYFARFNVPLIVVPDTSPFTTDYVDLKTGKVVPRYSPPDPTTALEIVAQQLLLYPYLPQGYDLPNPVPADLLLPFGEFITKYGIQDAVPLIFTFGHGVGEFLTVSTLYVFQNFGLPQLQSLLAGFLVTAHHDNSELYLKASPLLGSSVLYGSTLIRAERHVNGLHHITVQTPTGVKLIKAKKLLMTIPPILDNLTPFELDNHEHSVFSQWQYTTYFAGVIRDGIPANISISNTDATSTLHIPASPYVRNFDYSGIPDLHTFSTVSDAPQTLAQVEALITCDVQAMQSSGTLPASAPTIEVISNHTPIQMRVTAESISKGFYSDLYALQGRHGTFWTGAAWAPDDSSLLWAFTEETVFPALLAALA